MVNDKDIQDLKRRAGITEQYQESAFDEAVDEATHAVANIFSDKGLLSPQASTDVLYKINDALTELMQHYVERDGDTS